MSKIFSKIKSSILNTDDEVLQEDTSGRVFFKTSKSRVYFIIIFCAVIGIILIGRLFWLQIIDAEHNKKAAVQTRTISYKTYPKRGTIYDRNGNVLAYSKDAKTVYANPSEIDNVNETSEKLVQTIGGKASDYVDLLKDSNKKFVYIKRRIEVDQGKKVDELKLKGIYTQDDQKREYPYGQNAGQIVGACNFDGDGLCGLELYYDDVLRGTTGKTEKQQGLEGMPIPGGVVQNTKVVDGQDIMITIDIELQQKVEQVIQDKNKRMGSTSMSAMVVDPRNGEIYAAASLPLLDPNKIEKAEQGATDLKCISTNHEPGSTFKTISTMGIIENNALTPDSKFYCPATLNADEYKISDVHRKRDTEYTLRQILAESSNVGMALATERMGFDKLADKIKEYGIVDKTGVDFPGDTNGYMLDFAKWSKVQSYNISFGQGISVTPVQIVKFYTALANNGTETTPHFLMRYLQTEKDENFETKEIIKNKQAIPVVTDMLRSVVTEGTGKKADIPGYGVAGKTGTGEIADNKGKYYTSKFYDSFIGYLSTASIPLLGFVGADDAPGDTQVTQEYHDIMTFAIERFKVVSQ